MHAASVSLQIAELIESGHCACPPRGKTDKCARGPLFPSASPPTFVGPRARVINRSSAVPPRRTPGEDRTACSCGLARGMGWR